MLTKRLIFLSALSLFLVPAALAWGPGYWPQGGGFNAPYPPAEFASPNLRSGIRLEKTVDADGYLLRVHLDGIEPGAIDTQVARGSLLLKSSLSSMSKQSGDYGERSFSRSFSFHRRILLPRDADASRMVRNDSPGLIEIRLPRRPWN